MTEMVEMTGVVDVPEELEMTNTDILKMTGIIEVTEIVTGIIEVIRL